MSDETLRLERFLDGQWVPQVVTGLPYDGSYRIRAVEERAERGEEDECCPWPNSNRCCRERTPSDASGWPEGVSDGLSLPCGRCGLLPRFDYRVADDFWLRVVPWSLRFGVVCLPCLDELAHDLGEDVSRALEQVQWTGIGKTVVLRPEWTHKYPYSTTLTPTSKWLRKMADLEDEHPHISVGGLAADMGMLDTPTDASGERERIAEIIEPLIVPAGEFGTNDTLRAAYAAADRIIAMRPEPAREEEEGCTIRDILNLRTPTSKEP